MAESPYPGLEGTTRDERAGRPPQGAGVGQSRAGERRAPPEDTDDAAFYEQLHAALGGRLDGARGDIKRLNATLADFLERVELTATPDGGVRILPVLSETAAARILRDSRRWPHP